MATANQIQTLKGSPSLKQIFRTLQNQSSEIFSGVHNANSEIITGCLEKLAKLISPDDDEYIEELESFIGNGVCHVARNYGKTVHVSPIVVNYLMTAITSYNHVNKTPYRFTRDTCPNTNSHGNAFLVQVLIPHIDAGAHAFPSGQKFHVHVKSTPPVIRSPSPVGPRRPSISFGKAAKALQRERRTLKKKQGLTQGYRSNSSDTEGGRRRIARQRRQQKTKKTIVLTQNQMSFPKMYEK
jgi:hypothetical protein